MKLLHKEMNTKYLINSLASEFRNVLSKEKELDLAYCKFGPMCERLLVDAYKTHLFINSENASLDSVLKLNCARVKGRKDVEFEFLQTKFDNEECLIEYVKYLDRHKLYRLQEGCNVKQASGIVIIISMLLPGVCIDVRHNLSEIVKTVRRDWLPVSRQHKSYWMVSGMALVEIPVVAGSVTLLDGTELTEDNFVRLYEVIPSEFGRERLVDCDEFKDVWLTAIQSTKDIVSKRKTMLDYV